MDISDIKQTKFFVSLVWPGMIDFKCSKCGKLATTLQNRDVELIGEKIYIIKKMSLVVVAEKLFRKGC